MIGACGAQNAAPSRYPATGLVLMSLRDGSMRSGASIGGDPVAVTLSDDGKTAYVADSTPGDVYAVSLPNFHVHWKTHTGGAPFGLLVHGGRLYVTLYDNAEVAELDPSDGHVLTRSSTTPHPAAITVDSSGLVVEAGGSGFGIALVGDTLWTADYKQDALLPGGLGVSVPLPVKVHPFWLSPGPGHTLLIAAEGDSEDTDPGAVFSFDVMTHAFTTLARPRDPDQVISAGGAIFVAAHGDREVLAIEGGATHRWAQGASPVGLAADPSLGLLVVAVNSHE
ncbi:MAG TPA: hypothetical protein VKE27_05630 [Candidatus Dormibacteraeota bacterium]|nr:hypothetical protein [Candidatus Dormibacteraeota bacterium]